jgi:hypothetical protein
MTALCLTLTGPLTASLGAQTIRRPEPRAFRFSVTPYLGPGWGGPRALDNDPFVCSVAKCVTHRLGSSPVGGLEVHVPLLGTIALGLTVSAGRPNRVYCLVRACESRGRVTTVHGSALLLWRFRTRAPMYVGFGPALVHTAPGPVYSQRSATTEAGALVLAAFDMRFTSAVGLRVAWWNYFVGPSGAELTANAVPQSVVWESQITFGLALSFGSSTVSRPPRTFTAPPEKE